jgi:hypothetical protein
VSAAEASRVPPAPEHLRRLLYADLAVPDWPSGDDPQPEPWASFQRARRHLEAGDHDLAIRAWSQIANPAFAMESRQVLQAWHHLRSQGIVPDASIAQEVLGIVAEVALDGGHDVLAAYADGGVRFLHHLGGGTVVEPPAPEAVALAASGWLAEAQEVLAQMDPWEGTGEEPAPAGTSRFVALTRGGPRVAFGEGASVDPTSGPVAARLLGSGARLLAAITELAGS